jgi:nicotinate-nucleotide adenylyltransferase
MSYEAPGKFGNEPFDSRLFLALAQDYGERSRTMRIALFGGTFDPIHWGHLLLAEAARTSHRLDRIVFLPTYFPPHKTRPTASAADRLRMVRLAIASNPHFSVSDWEIRQGRIVYSYETIAHFRGLWPRNRLFFILGSDMLKLVPYWRQGSTILKQCQFLVAERTATPWTKISASLRRQAKRISWPTVPLASHDIRALIRHKKSVRYQVPDAVERYIQKHRLYR